MKSLLPAVLVLLLSAVPPLHGQSSSTADDSYRLYLTQIAAAEALLQLNLISDANEYLNACDPKFRSLEWHFLRAALHQSNQTTTGGDAKFNDVKVSPDGKLLAAARSDSVIALYAPPGMKLLRELRGHRGSVTTLAFSNDGKRLASGGRDHNVIVWNVASGAQMIHNDTSFSQGIYQVKFSPDNAMLGVVSWERVANRTPGIFGFVKLLDAGTAAPLKKIELDNHPAAGIVFTPDSRTMILSTWGEVAYSYDVTSARLNWTYDLSNPAEYNAFHGIDMSPDGNTVALGAADHRVHILKVSDGKLLHRIEPWDGHTKLVKTVAYSRDGRYIATAGEDQSVLIWSTLDYTKKWSLVGHVDAVTGLSWSAGSAVLHSASADGTLQTWDLSRPFSRSYEICNFGPWQTPYSTRGKFFAAPCSDKKLVLYDPATGNVIASLGEQGGLCADISADGKSVVTASFDGVVRLWDVQAAKEVRSYSGHTARVDGIRYLNSTEKILSVGDTTLRIWDAKSEKLVRTVPLGRSPFRLVCTPEESLAIVGFSGGSVRIFETKTWEEKSAFSCESGIQEMTISRDGKSVAIFSGKDIEVWEVRSSKRSMVLKGHGKAGYGLGFSPDGKYLISGSDDQAFRLWDLATGTCTLTYHAYQDVIYSAQFLSQKEILLSSSQGKVWYYRF